MALPGVEARIPGAHIQTTTGYTPDAVDLRNFRDDAPFKDASQWPEVVSRAFPHIMITNTGVYPIGLRIDDSTRKAPTSDSSKLEAFRKRFDDWKHFLHKTHLEDEHQEGVFGGMMDEIINGQVTAKVIERVPAGFSAFIIANFIPIENYGERILAPLHEEGFEQISLAVGAANDRDDYAVSYPVSPTLRAFATLAKRA